MNHSDLITVVAVVAPVTEALARGEEVKLNNFGAFEIAASRSVKFKAVKALRDAPSPATSKE